MSDIDKNKVKELFDKLILKSIPAFVPAQKSSSNNFDYPVLSIFFNEISLLKEILRICVGDEFKFAQKLHSENPKRLIFTASEKAFFLRKNKKMVIQNF